MFFNQFLINFFLFFFCIFGIILNRKNLLITLMCIELMLININTFFAVSSSYLDDFYGQIFSLFILTIGAAESALGLALIIGFFKIHGHIKIEDNSLLRF